jgi:hypothetical protein
MSFLRQKQVQFASMVPRLIDKAIEMGYEVTLGDAYRDGRVFGPMGESKGYGKASSCHKIRLAIDLNLFKDGRFLSTTEDHRPLGEWWKSQGGSWGGDFNDGNHYSLEHEGHR